MVKERNLERDPLFYLEGLGAVRRVKRYYQKFSGGRFELLAGGGDRPETADVFTSDDLVAVSLLSVNIPGRAALYVLETESKPLSELLRKVPTGLDLWEAPIELVADGHEADQLWQALKKIPGIGWVTAGKLCARKRPQLLPVFDQVVKAALSPNRKDFWTALHTTLTERPEIVQRLAEIKELARAPDGVSLLRVLDVAVWMTSQSS